LIRKVYWVFLCSLKKALSFYLIRSTRWSCGKTSKGLKLPSRATDDESAAWDSKPPPPPPPPPKASYCANVSCKSRGPHFTTGSLNWPSVTQMAPKLQPLRAVLVCNSSCFAFAVSYLFVRKSASDLSTFLEHFFQVFRMRKK